MKRIIPAIAALLLSATSIYADCLTGPVAATWTGTGDRNTEPFTTTGAPLRMTYSVGNPRTSYPQICWRMKTMDNKIGPGGCIQQSEGETFIYTPAGTYYMDISASGDFTVTLEQTGS